MSYNDLLGEALDEADNRGIIDYDDRDSVDDFTKEFEDLMRDENGDLRDEFPSADELSEDERERFMDWLDENEMWDAFRDEWEDYKEQ